MPPITLASLNQLFTDAWELTKSRFWSVMILWFIQGLIVFLIGAAAVGALMTSPFGESVVAYISGSDNTTTGSVMEFIESLPRESFNSVIFTFLAVFALIAIVLGPLFQAATIALTASEEKIGVIESLKRGLSKFVPSLAAGLIMAFFVFGGMFLFIIPGIVFGFLCMFALFEIVLYNASPLQAIKTSVGMVKQRFWPVAGRLLLLMILSMGIALISQGLQEQYNALFSLLDTVIGSVFSVFSMMYLVALYKNLRATMTEVSTNLTGITLLSVLGWVGIILFIFIALQAV